MSSIVTIVVANFEAGSAGSICRMTNYETQLRMTMYFVDSNRKYRKYLRAAFQHTPTRAIVYI